MHEPSRRIPYRTWPGALAVLLAIAAYVGDVRSGAFPAPEHGFD